VPGRGWGGKWSSHDWSSILAITLELRVMRSGDVEADDDGLSRDARLPPEERSYDPCGTYIFGIYKVCSAF
jgi:hypothetical protein